MTLRDPGMLHAGAPPKPSGFPLAALVLLGGGAFAANARWNAGPALAAVVSLSGLGSCLLAFLAGRLLAGSRRAGFLAGLLLAAAAPLWRAPPLEPWHAVLPPLAFPAAGLGWLLAAFSEGRLPRAGDVLVRSALAVFGAGLALLPLAAALGARLNWISPAVGLVPLGCLALAGAVIVGLCAAGRGRHWPAAEAAAVAAAASAICAGLAANQ